MQSNLVKCTYYTTRETQVLNLDQVVYPNHFKIIIIHHDLIKLYSRRRSACIS